MFLEARYAAHCVLWDQTPGRRSLKGQTKDIFCSCFRGLTHSYLTLPAWVELHVATHGGWGDFLPHGRNQSNEGSGDPLQPSKGTVISRDLSISPAPTGQVPMEFLREQVLEITGMKESTGEL